MRIRGLERNEATWSMRTAFFLLKRQFGKVLTPYRVWAHRPAITIALTSLMAATEYSKALDPIVKSIVSIRAAQMIGCPF
jgi:alkylhydroperoxidase family enzyme